MADDLITSEVQPMPLDDGTFVRVRFAGGRFDQHAIPFSMLPELDAYRGLIVEVAKHLFFKRNPDRKRVPKGFSESFELALSGLVTGNSATVLARRLPVDMPRVQAALDFAKYIEFEDARDLVDQVMANAARNERLPDDFPSNLADRFNRIGQGLGSTEFLEFSHGSSAPVRYDSSARKRIVLSAYPTYEGVVDERFLLNGGNVQKHIIHLLTEDGRAFDLLAKNDSDLDRAITRRRNHVRLVGTGQFTSDDQLTRISDYAEIIHSDDEPQQSYSLRLREIARTEPGWYSPGNPAPSRHSIARMESFLAEAVAHWGIPFPFIFPTPEGSVRAEWTRGDTEISATVSEDGSSLILHAINLVSDHERASELDLDAENYPENFNAFWNQLDSEDE